VSIEYWMQAKCDKCQAVIEPLRQVKATMMGSTRWEWAKKWKASGVMVSLRSLYGKQKLYCAACAGK